MSHVIPIVSSSPPPLDVDDAGLGWNDEDDDDFGNFTSAPHPSSENANSFDFGSSKSDLSLPGDTFTVIKVESKGNLVKSSTHEISLAKVDGVAVIENCNDDFQDLTEFKDNPGQTLESEKQQSNGNNFHCSVERGGLDSSLNHCTDKLSAEQDSSSLLANNESVYSNTSTIDSGVFSTDLSPSTRPSNVLTLSSDFSSFEKQGVFVQSLEEASHTDISTGELDPAVPDRCQSAKSNEDWSDFNADFDSAEEETLKRAKNIEGDELHSTDNVIDDEDLILHPVSLSSENAELEPVISKETLLSSSLEAGVGSDVKEKEKINVIQSVSLVSPENAALDTVSTGHSLVCSSLVASSTYDGSDASDMNSYSPENQLETESRVDNDEWGEFDSKVSIESADIVNVENNADIVHDSVSAQQSGDKVNEEISQHVLDLGKSTETVDSLSTASDLYLAAGSPCVVRTEDTDQKMLHLDQEDHMKDDAEHDNEFGSFSTAHIRKDSDPDKEVAPITFRTSVCEVEGGESSSDEFGFTGQVEFKDSVLQDGEEDFGDFDEARHVEHLDNDDDEFGEFGSASRSECGPDIDHNINVNLQQEDDNDWADFDEANPVQPETSSQDILTTQNMSRSTEIYDENKTQKWEKAVVSCFPKISEITLQDSQDEGSCNEDGTPSACSCDFTTLDTVVELGLSNPLEAKQQSWTVVQHPSKKDPKVKLWSSLKDVDSSHALLYTWSTSYCSKEVFLTLHIDTQNVLFTQKKQAVPFFASGLNLLEPIRGGAESKNNRHISPATLLDTNRPDITQNVTSVQDIPPVDFDWSSSGLTNPLAANTLDLDFLVVQGSDSFEKTSDEWDWVFKTDSQESTRSSLQPLEDILKKSTPTAKLATFETLSPEALRILDRMPDLKFMHSRVLMFPVKQ